MQSESERLILVCPFNGQSCRNGKRKDFPDNEVGEKSQCRFWTHLAGKDPQSNKVVDQWDCAIAWMPVLLTENAQMSRHTTASVDKMVNTFVGILPDAMRKKLPSINKPLLNNPNGGNLQ